MNTTQKIAQKMTAKARFLQYVRNVEIKRNLQKYPESIHFYNGKQFLAEYHSDFPEYLWVAGDIWDIYIREYKMNRHEVSKFLQEQIHRHFKVKLKPQSWDDCK